jgi:short-subunit dehydrogenase
MALSAELTGSGVRALSVCPGVTATGQRSEDILPGGLGGIRRPEQVVTTTFRALQTGKASVVDGRRNAALVRLALRHLPERAVLALTRRITEPGLGSK